jgi:hypothetical protein
VPYSEPGDHRRHQKDLVARNRNEYLASHPCGCGQPGVSFVAGPMIRCVPKGLFSWRPERMAEALAKCLTVCAECGETQMRVQLAGMRQRQVALSPPKPPKAKPAPKRPLPRSERAPVRRVEPEPIIDISPSVTRKPKSKPKLLSPTDFAAEMAEQERRRSLQEWREERRERLGYGL